MNLHQLFNSEIRRLIDEYNTNRKFNEFLYNNLDCHRLFKDKYLPFGSYPGDRFVFVDRCNTIGGELTPIIHKLYHGRKVRVTGFGLGQGVHEGIIEHALIRTFTRYESTEQHATCNSVSFRGLNDGNAICEQTVALWINTGSGWTTHLYTADRIELLELTEEEMKIASGEVVYSSDIQEEIEGMTEKIETIS